MRALLLIVFLSLVGCAPKAELEDLETLNGYWVIEKVTFPDNSVKTYDISTTIDYISYKEGKGYRKKVKPSLDGIYTTSDDAIPFASVETEGAVYLRYTNDSESWEEEVLMLQAKKFSVRNEDGIQYMYSRYEPLEILNE
ncbi:MAG: hypothetical protein HKN89_10430 [Eudoraea sp.]|nr:hypothetical protein [Eudoraea sp.]